MFLIFLIILLLFFILFFKKKNNNLSLPGPLSLPIIGNLYYLLFLGGNGLPQLGMSKMNKKYGKLVSLNSANQIIVISEDYELIKEVLYSDDWIDRPYSESLQRLSFGKEYGIIFVSGEHWKELRRFTLRTLRDFGFGKKSSMEEFITEEFKDLSSRLDQSIDDGNSILPINRFFTLSVLNILWGMIAGIRYSHDSQEMNEIINKIYYLSKNFAIGKDLKDAFPFMSSLLDRFEPGTIKNNKKVDELQNYIRDCLLKRRAEEGYKEYQRDFIDVYLNAIDESKNGPNREIFNDDSFVAVTLDLFMAGAETTANTLEFSILWSILNPWVQKEAQEEIDKVIGTRSPRLEDIPNMPFIQATMHEIQRLGSIIPTDARSSQQDSQIGEFKLPKGTIFLTNFYSMHRSKEMWEDPDTFNPKRFLDSENKVINGNKIFPFGGGKRVCLGELLARSTLFLYYSNLMQKYSFNIPNNHQKPSTKPELGFTLNPQNFLFQIKHRN